MTLLKKRMPLIILVLSSVAVAGVLADLLSGQYLVELMAKGGGGVSTRQGKIEAVYAIDVSDKRKLVGSASNVFVGRVIGKSNAKGEPGSDSEDPLELEPYFASTQFVVAVTKNIKGEIKGPVTVNQDGGYVEYAADKDYPEFGVKKGERVRELSLMEDDPLLKPGQEVVLATSYVKQYDWYQIVAQPQGDVRIPRDQQSETGRLTSKDQVKRRQIIGEFEEAVRNEIIDPVLTREPIPNEDRPDPEQLPIRDDSDATSTN